MSPNDEPVYRVGKVAELTGLSTHVLRVWERRYGAVVPERTEKGGRLYTDRDVERLRLLAELARTGHAIGTIANLSDDELAAMASAADGEARGARAPELEGLIARFLEAVARFDERAAERILGQAALGLEPRALVTAFFGKVLREVGERWATGELRIAHEHLVSALVRDLLVTVRKMHGVAEAAPRALVSTVRGERHEFGALMAAVLASMHGFRTLYLGTDLPAEEIAHAARSAEAELVLLSIPSDVEGVAAGEIDAIADGLEGSELIYGGAGAPITDSARARLVENFDALSRLLESRRRGGR